MEINTNAARLIELGVAGAIQTPASNGYIVTEGGRAMILPQLGGICYNVKIGDSVFGWAGEATEPGVALYCEDRAACMALVSLSCAGNDVIVADGDAKGARGYVIGKHNMPELSSNHVIAHFEQDVLDRLNIGDRMLVRAYGTGLAIEGMDDIRFHSTSPRLLSSLDPELDARGDLVISAAAEIPGHLMGFIMGAPAYIGDFDLMTDDRGLLEEAGLMSLCLGDIVYMKDCDCSYVKSRCAGSATVGVVTTANNPVVGRGVGVMPLISSASGRIKPRLTGAANLRRIMEGWR